MIVIQPSIFLGSTGLSLQNCLQKRVRSRLISIDIRVIFGNFRYPINWGGISL